MVVQFSVESVGAIIKYRPLEKIKQDIVCHILSLGVKSTMSHEIGGKSSVSLHTRLTRDCSKTRSVSEECLLITDPL